MKKSTNKTTKVTNKADKKIENDTRYPFATLQKKDNQIFIRAKHNSLSRAIEYSNTRDNSFIVNLLHDYNKKWFKGIFVESYHSNMISELTTDQKKQIEKIKKDLKKKAVEKKKAKLQKKIAELQAQL